MTVSGSTSAGYTATKLIAIAAGTTYSVEEIEMETGGQFSKLYNYPNPLTDKTTFSFILAQSFDVEVSISMVRAGWPTRSRKQDEQAA